jgi:hypothetical protein
MAPRSPYGPADSGAPAASRDFGAVQPQEPVASGPPRRTVERAAAPQRPDPPRPGQNACPACGRGVDAGRRFCRCGTMLAAPALRAPAPARRQRLPWYRRLGELIGSGRDFRRAMRAANGGLRVTYSAAVSTRVRFVRATMVLGMLGIGLSQLGPWGQDVRTRLAAQADRVVPHRYAAVPLESVAADPDLPGIEGFDLRYAVDGDAERAWAAGWRPPVATGPPCQRAGGAQALLVTFRKPAAVERITVRAGLAKGNDKRTLQYRPRQLDVLYSDGTCRVVDLADDAGEQAVGAKAAGVTSARIVIVDAYPPSDRGDGLVSLSEIGFEARK